MKPTPFAAMVGACKGCGRVFTIDDAYKRSKDSQWWGNALNEDGYCRKCKGRTNAAE